MPDAEEREGPKQSVKRLPDDQPDVGPFFPSGMSAPEAALAGATADMSDEEIELLKAREEGREPATTVAKKDDSE